MTGSTQLISSPTRSPWSPRLATGRSASSAWAIPLAEQFQPTLQRPGPGPWHGLLSPDHRTIAVVSIGSNSVAFIDTATNVVKHITYVGRAPHEAFFTPDGKEVWVTVRGENYVDVLDGKTFMEKTRIITPAGPGMQIFSPDGKYGYVCSSFNPETDVVSVATHNIVARVKQASPFCPNIAATPDGTQVWFTLKDTGKTEVFDAKPPFTVLKVLETGPITNHVNFVHNANGTFAYVTIGGLNEVKVFRTSDFSQVATIPVGALPHGIWPSGDGNRVYVGLENGDGVTAIDTLTNRVIATIPIGQAPQAITYVPDAVPSGPGTQNLQSLGVAWPGRTSYSCGFLYEEEQSAHQRLSVRSRPDPGAAGLGVRIAAEAVLPARPRREPGWHRRTAGTATLHDEPRWRGDRQCHRSNSAARGERCEGTASLSGDRAGKRHGAWRSGAGAGPMTNGRPSGDQRLPRRLAGGSLQKCRSAIKSLMIGYANAFGSSIESPTDGPAPDHMMKN